MTYLDLNLLTRIILVGIACAVAFTHENQYRLGSDNIQGVEGPDSHSSRLKCDLSRPIDPSADGLLSSHKVFSGKDALETIIERHQQLVRIPSICYDDLGEFDEDERWEPFHKIPGVLSSSYPNVYKNALIETINEFGLLYRIQGSDPSLSPILLAAHQDVVPVEKETLDRWEHPPFEAHYDEEDGYIWGRGASDDKSAITAIMSAMEALLSQEEYQPRRSVILAFGFDEECSGYRGAAKISKHLEKQYGKGGIALILDEGGGGLQHLGDTLYALPAVYEKGYLDVWFDLDVMGGHSSTPTPHTAIGIMSEIVTTLEANPFKPRIIPNSPVHQALVCLARYSPDALPELTHLIYDGNLKAAARFLAEASRDTQYFIQTSQAVDSIAGGQKINSLPEYTTLGVNHRIAPQDSIGGIQYRVVDLVENVARKYGLQLRAFEGDEDYDEYLASQGISRPGESAGHLWKPIYNGTLVLKSGRKSHITPYTPTSGPIWSTFAGTVRHTFAQAARTVVVAPGAMTANTDSRHYLDLSSHIYRWTAGSIKSFSNIHSINERLLIGEHLDMARFYYDFIRNCDREDF
ncbi:hypothetical protein F5X98DRAFT_381972 [Xylaria grammica]|nr:hypothetical protein F5X98DRAFT_381972 [Xylaria grammica]